MNRSDSYWINHFLIGLRGEYLVEKIENENLKPTKNILLNDNYEKTDTTEILESTTEPSEVFALDINKNITNKVITNIMEKLLSKTLADINSSINENKNVSTEINKTLIAEKNISAEISNPEIEEIESLETKSSESDEKIVSSEIKSQNDDKSMSEEISISKNKDISASEEIISSTIEHESTPAKISISKKNDENKSAEISRSKIVDESISKKIDKSTSAEINSSKIEKENISAGIGSSNNEDRSMPAETEISNKESMSAEISNSNKKDKYVLGEISSSEVEEQSKPADMNNSLKEETDIGSHEISNDIDIYKDTNKEQTTENNKNSKTVSVKIIGPPVIQNFGPYEELKVLNPNEIKNFLHNVSYDENGSISLKNLPSFRGNSVDAKFIGDVLKLIDETEQKNEFYAVENNVISSEEIEEPDPLDELIKADEFSNHTNRNLDNWGMEGSRGNKSSTPYLNSIYIFFLIYMLLFHKNSFL